MASKTIYKYRYFDTNLSEFAIVWQETAPVGSNIDTLSVTIIDQISESKTQIINNDKTQGHYMMEGLNIQIPEGTLKQTTIKTFPMPISCYAVYCYPTECNINDHISCSVPLPTSPIISNVPIGGSNITVPTQLSPYFDVGMNVSLSNSNITQSLGRIVNVSGDVISTEIAASNEFAAGDKIISRVYFVKDMMFPVVNKYVIGQGTLNGTYIPAKTPVIIDYFNNNSNAKNIVFHLEYTY